MSASKEKNINLEFKINNIELVEKSFHVPVLNGTKLPDTQFILSLNVSIDKTNKRIINLLEVKIKSVNNDAIVATVTIACAFDITNFEEIVVFSEDVVTIPDPVIETLNIITIGTTRGIMFNEFKGTWLHKAVLPVIDPKSFKQMQEQ